MKFSMLVIAACLASAPLGAIDTRLLPPELQGIGIDQNLGAQLPLDTVFRDESGRTVRLGDYFGRRPVLLAFVYYTCPMLCNQILTGEAAALKPLSLRPGRDFDVLAISINPSETPADATAKRAFTVRRYSSKASDEGWHFLTGDEASIQAATQAAGFHYRYDAASKMFFHASAVMAVTPAGKIARYFYGVDYEPKDLKLGLIEASGNKIGSAVDQILLFCYHYDAAKGKYGAAVVHLLQASAALTVILMALVLGVYWRRESRRSVHL